MAASDVAVANLALQKLGAARITSLTEDSRNARSINACYEHVRDTELRRHKWNFARSRTTLAPSAVTPDHWFDYAFPLPVLCLRLLPPAVHGLDWQIEQHEGQTCVLTNDGDTLEIEFISKITDPTRFDDCFTEMLACKIAWHCCEEITQSNAKKADIMVEYREARSEARRNNAFENTSEEPPEDPWLAARR
jgi:hypothetical protein